MVNQCITLTHKDSHKLIALGNLKNPTYQQYMFWKEKHANLKKKGILSQIWVVFKPRHLLRLTQWTMTVLNTELLGFKQVVLLYYSLLSNLVPVVCTAASSLSSRARGTDHQQIPAEMMDWL